MNVKRNSFLKTIKSYKNNFSIEPIIVLGLLSRGISAIAVQHLILEKGCRVNLALGDDICDALSFRNESYPNYNNYEQQVQTLAANMFIWRDLISSLFPCILLFFVGSWSDRNKKRKQIILNNFIADIITYSCFLICTYFFNELPLEVNILADALPQICGGLMLAHVGVMSYLSELSKEKNRTGRFSIFFFCLNVSTCVSFSLNGIAYQNIGFYGVFSLNLIFNALALLYGIFFVKDSWQLIENETNTKVVKKCNFINDFFDCSNIMKTLKVALVKRDAQGRKKIWLILLIAFLNMGSFRGETNLSYYFIRYKFHWSPVQYSMFVTLEFVVIMCGTLISLILLTKILKIHDGILGVISCVGKILARLLFTFGPTAEYLYMGAVLNMFHEISRIVMMSFPSKLVSPEETGKFYSILIIFECLSPIIFCPIYSKVYTETINIFAGTFYIVTVLTQIPGIFIYGWFYLESRKSRKLQKSIEEPEQLPCLEDTIIEQK